MNEINTTKYFRQWIDNLKDAQAKKKILQRIERAKNNNFGDYKQLAENLFEMRIFMIRHTEFIIPNKKIQYICS